MAPENLQQDAKKTPNGPLVPVGFGMQESCLVFSGTAIPQQDTKKMPGWPINRKPPRSKTNSRWHLALGNPKSTRNGTERTVWKILKIFQNIYY